jgi:hypothetical protein
MSSVHSRPPWVRVLVSSVLNEAIPRICDLIVIDVIPQAFSPANVVFSGIGVLLLVSIILDLSIRATMTLGFVRRLKM